MNRGLPLPGSGWRGFTLQMFLMTVLPLTVLLLAITFGSLTLHHASMRALVGDRDLRAVRAAANSLAHEVSYRATTLALFAGQLSQSPNTAAFLDANGLPGFDGGLALVGADGKILAGGLAGFGPALTPEQLDALDHTSTSGLPAPNTFRVPNKSTIQEGGSPSLAVSVAGPLRRQDGAWVVLAWLPAPGGRLVGAFTPEALARAALTGIATPQTGVLLVAPGGKVLYQVGDFAPNRPVADRPGVYEVLSGESGVNYTSGAGITGHMPGMGEGDPAHSGEHVVAFSPVTPPGWGLVMEEPWEASAGPLLQATQYAPLLLAPVLILAILALWFGARQIVQPLQALEGRAGRLAAGEFGAIQAPVGGISEIQQLQGALVEMARALQAAQAALHGYIGALTTGVEAERRALARELHDDTLQSLIALNQQVQMALLRAGDTPQRQPLLELQARTGQAITNLRRAIGGLRPIYLEDLGLSAALGMLAKGAEGPDRPRVQYSISGPERRMPPEAELTFYRIAQEALNNAIHHAGAAQVELALRFGDDGRVELTIRDDGQGFSVPADPNAFARHGHFGLLGMRERAELAGAQFGIESGEGGTLVRVVV